MFVSTVISDTFTLQDLCRQILNENEGLPGIPSGAMGLLINRCQCFKVDPPIQIGGREEEDLVAECQNRAARQRKIAKSTMICEVIKSTLVDCVQLFVNLIGELMKIIPKIRD